MSVKPEERSMATGAGGAPGTRPTPEEIVALVDEQGLRLIRFLWCGNDGTMRAKAAGRHGRGGSGAGP